MVRRSLFYLALLAPATTFAATVLERTDGPDLPPANPLPAGWSYTGCFADSPSMRILNDANYQDDTGMTGATCMAFCTSNGYPYAGTEYASECYCGLTPPTGPTTGCNMGCTGNTAEACGGPGTITVYENPPLTPHIYPGDDCWSSQGCYTDSPSARSLERVVTPSGPGVEACLATCKGQGFTWAGVEYGSECWCGNVLADTALITLDGCDMTCQGRVDEFCGGAGSLNAYKLADTCAPPPSTTTTTTTTTDSTTTTTSATPNPSPICGATGYDLNQPAAAALYNGPTDFATCGSTCSEYQSFAFSTTQCLCYSGAVNGNYRSDENSPFAFYDKTCAAPTTPTTTTTTTTTATTTTTTTTTTKSPAGATSTTTTTKGWTPWTTRTKKPVAATTTTTTTKPVTTTTKSTTTTKTPTPTTTTCTTTLKTTTTKASTTTTSTCRPSKPTGLIPNGGFESSGPFSWTPATSGPLSGYTCPKTGGYEGCKTYVISPNPGSSSSSRCHTLTMPSCISPGSARALEFYLGRRTHGAPSAAGASVTVSVGGWKQTVQAPSGGSCDLTGQNGTVWKKVSFSVPSVSGKKNADLVVSVNWPGGSKCNVKGGEDDVLVDGVNLW